MAEVARLRKNLFKHVSIIAIVISSVLFLVGRVPIAYGYLLGCLGSMVNFHLLSIDVGSFQVNAQKRMIKILMIRYFLRYLCIALMFVGAMKYEIHIVAFAIGFFICQLILLINGIRTTRGVR